MIILSVGKKMNTLVMEQTENDVRKSSRDSGRLKYRVIKLEIKEASNTKLL